MNREWRFWVLYRRSKSRHIYTGVTNDMERRVGETSARAKLKDSLSDTESIDSCVLRKISLHRKCN